MIVPNKFYSFDESIAKRIIVVMSHREQSPMTIRALFKECRKGFSSIEQFLLALEVLYVLNAVDIDLDSEIVTYAD